MIVRPEEVKSSQGREQGEREGRLRCGGGSTEPGQPSPGPRKDGRFELTFCELFISLFHYGH